MIMDKSLEFSLAQAVTVSAPSTNVVDAGVKGDDNSKIFIYAKVSTAATAAGAATLTVSVQTAIDAAFTTPVTLITTAAIPVASLTANAEIVKVRLPLGVLRYIRLYYTVATGPLTAGAIDAEMVLDVPAAFN